MLAIYLFIQAIASKIIIKFDYVTYPAELMINKDNTYILNIFNKSIIINNNDTTYYIKLNGHFKGYIDGCEIVDNNINTAQNRLIGEFDGNINGYFVNGYNNYDLSYVYISGLFNGDIYSCGNNIIKPMETSDIITSEIIDDNIDEITDEQNKHINKIINNIKISTNDINGEIIADEINLYNSLDDQLNNLYKIHMMETLNNIDKRLSRNNRIIDYLYNFAIYLYTIITEQHDETTNYINSAEEEILDKLKIIYDVVEQNNKQTNNQDNNEADKQNNKDIKIIIVFAIVGYVIGIFSIIYIVYSVIDSRSRKQKNKIISSNDNEDNKYINIDNV